MTVEVYRDTMRRCDVIVEVYRGTVGRCDCRGVQGHRGEM